MIDSRPVVARGTCMQAKCATCGGRIVPGSWVLALPSGGLLHALCADVHMHMHALEEPRVVELVDRLSSGLRIPEGYDRWGLKTVNPSRRTSNDFFWPEPGGTVKSWKGPEVGRAAGCEGIFGYACPKTKGDGLTVALTPSAMSSGGLPLGTILLVAYRWKDVVGWDEEKVRTSGNVRVVDEFRPREVNYADVDMRSANFKGGDLREVRFHRTNLAFSFFRRAMLQFSGFSNCNLASSDFSLADLKGVTFQGEGSLMNYSNFAMSSLEGASFFDCTMNWVDFTGADVRNATFKNVKCSASGGIREPLQKARNAQWARVCSPEEPF